MHTKACKHPPSYHSCLEYTLLFIVVCPDSNDVSWCGIFADYFVHHCILIFPAVKAGFVWSRLHLDTKTASDNCLSLRTGTNWLVQSHCSIAPFLAVQAANPCLHFSHTSTITHVHITCGMRDQRRRRRRKKAATFCLSACCQPAEYCLQV